MGKGVNAKHLSKLDPSVRKNFERFLNGIIALGYTPIIRDSKRTYEQQAYYYKKDKRNAKPGHGKHETGEAIDLDIYKNGKLVLTKSTPDVRWIFSGIPTVAKKYGIGWGGDFKGYPDNNHYYFST